jgi:hypothetical protein
MSQKPPTYYVVEPRNQPCHQVNPLLWAEFSNRFGFIKDPRFFTEEYCVQWLDNYYELLDMYKSEEHAV